MPEVMIRNHSQSSTNGPVVHGPESFVEKPSVGDTLDLYGANFVVESVETVHEKNEDGEMVKRVYVDARYPSESSI